MSHDLEMLTGLPALAFTGDRKNIWHSLGQSIDELAAKLGRPLTSKEIFALAQCAFEVYKAPLSYTDANGKLALYPNAFAHLRNDTHTPVGKASEGYELVQPDDLRQVLDKYVEADPRFRYTTVGLLENGKRLWAQLSFENGLSVGGDEHQLFLIASTSFDTFSSTIGKCGAIRVVCANTHAGMMGEKTPVIRIRHNTKFDADRARKELAEIAKGFESFKRMGDAMASVVLTRDDIGAFIRDILDIPRTLTAQEVRDTVSTRKLNQRQAIIDRLLETANQRNEKHDEITAFSAFEAVAAYADHDRDPDSVENRLFGSGQALKDKAVDKLMAHMERTLEASKPVYASAGPVALPAAMAAQL